MIVPDPIDLDEVKRSTDSGLFSLLSDAKETFRLTYWNWENENQPSFQEDGPKTINNHRELGYFTVDTPYVWVDSGTRPHRIVAKNAPALTFQTNSIPKTKPSGFTSMSGAPGTEWRRAEAVDNPGIKARDFSTKGAERLNETAEGIMQTEIDNMRSL